MLVLEERIGWNVAQIGRQSSHRQVHLGQLLRGGRELLTVHRDVFGIAMVRLHELQRLHKHPAAAAAWIVDFAFVRLDHFRDQIHHALGRIKLASQFAFGRRAFSEGDSPRGHATFYQSARSRTQSIAR